MPMPQRIHLSRRVHNLGNKSVDMTQNSRQGYCAQSETEISPKRWTSEQDDEGQAWSGNCQNEAGVQRKPVKEEARIKISPFFWCEYPPQQQAEYERKQQQ